MTDHKRLFSLLKKYYGYTEFRKNQLEIIESILSGHDTLGVLPTGGGKSLCFQLPALYLDKLCVVISPLISLMKDQVQNLQQNDISGCFINSSLSYEEKEDVSKSVESGETKILYISPEGLQTSFVIDILQNNEVALFAVDEAHCISSWGHEFRSDYKKLSLLKEMFPSTPILALTATADEKTRDDICQQLRFRDPNVFISSFDRENIKYLITSRGEEIKQVDDFIRTKHENETGIIYCLSRKKVEAVTAQLQENGHNAVAYHAGLPKAQRDKNQNRFKTEPAIIVVATIAFGMGIDRPDVRFVAHLDLPKSIEGYYQETGRAGRDGLPSTAWMIYGLQDVVKHSQMLERTEASEQYKKIARSKLDAMLSLCETADCRRQFLLNYFDEEGDKSCNNCDSCLFPAELIDATEDGQKLLSTVFKSGQIFGANYIIEILRGSKNKKVLQRKHDQLSVYGIGSNRSKQHWSCLIRQLLNRRYLRIKNWEYNNLALTSKCSEILKGEEKILIREDKSHKTTVRKESKSVPDFHKSHGRDSLFEELRSLRADLAKEQSVPPYIIFNDRSLHDMCALLPRNRDDFLLVHGVGETKYQKYGQKFLNVIQSS